MHRQLTTNLIAFLMNYRHVHRGIHPKSILSIGDAKIYMRDSSIIAKNFGFYHTNAGKQIAV